jgi:hypothetical protein
MVFFEYLVNLIVYEFLILGCSAPLLILIFGLSRFLTRGTVGHTNVGTGIASLIWLVGAHGSPTMPHAGTCFKAKDSSRQLEVRLRKDGF